MASIKVLFKLSAVGGNEGCVGFRITHERRSRVLPTGYHLFAGEWDANRSMVRLRQGERCSFVMAVGKSIRCDVGRLKRIIRKLDDSGVGYSVDDVVEEFMRYASEYSLCNYMARIIHNLKENGRLRTSETYASALNSFRKFIQYARKRDWLLDEEDIMLDCIDSEVVERYEVWLRQRGLSPNTTSFYMRILRAVYNRALEDDAIEGCRPFRHVYTGVERTVKRALSLAVIRRMRGLDLSQQPSLDYARDIFMLSFMLRGMSFIDMAFLRKEDIRNGYITYRRRKTGQLLTIEWTREMQIILDKYPENKSDYLLPIIKNPDTNERCIYRNAGYNINHNLKKIAKMVGINVPLTLYVARHSWASVAKAKGVPLSVISEGMGHDSETTTQIYLASLDASFVHEANSLILSSL